MILFVLFLIILILLTLFIKRQKDTFIGNTVDYNAYPQHKIESSLYRQTAGLYSEVPMSHEPDVSNRIQNTYNQQQYAADFVYNANKDKSYVSDGRNYDTGNAPGNTGEFMELPGGWSCTKQLGGCNRFCDQSPLPEPICHYPDKLKEPRREKTYCHTNTNIGWQFESPLLAKDTGAITCKPDGTLLNGGQAMIVNRESLSVPFIRSDADCPFKRTNMDVSVTDYPFFKESMIPSSANLPDPITF